LVDIGEKVGNESLGKVISKRKETRSCMRHASVFGGEGQYEKVGERQKKKKKTHYRGGP